MSKWKMVKLGEVCEQINGVSYKPNDVSETLLEHYIPVLRAHNIQDDGLNADKLVYVREEIVNPRQIIINDDIIICASSGSKNLVGKAAQSNKSSRVSFGAFCKVIRPKNINGKYLGHFFQTPKYRQIISELSAGANINNLRKEDIASLEIPLPPIEEQKRIADILDKANSLIYLRKQQLEKMDLLIKSKFIDMFGDPVTNPKGWQLVPLMEAGSCKNGMNFRLNEVGVEIHCLGVGDFKDLSVIEDTHNLPTISLNEMPTSEYLLQDGDIVFVRSNGNKALVGRCLATYPGIIPTTYSGFCIRYRKSVDTLLTKYLLQVFKAPSMREKIAGRGANIQNLNQQILSEMNIPVPPIELQNQFAEFVEQVEKQKAVMQQSLETMETNYKALMQEYFG